MPLHPPETWIFRCLSKLKTIAAKALLGGRVGFFLIAVVTDSTAISTVVLFCLLVSFMALSFDTLIENGHVTQPSLRRAIIS